ncbi:MAG: hypothetical protein ABL957_08885 [Parvularculaceae bacterium]
MPLGFSINFGAGPVDTLYVSENGVVTFGAALPEGDAGNGSLNVRDYIAALYTDLISIDEPEDALGEITWAPGRIDPTEDPALDDDTSPLSWFQGERGFKIDWHGVTRGSGERVYLQIAILDRPGNDFDLQINHGYLPNTVMQRQGAKVGFKLGANFFQLNGGAIGNAQNLEFQFRNGACMNC